MPPELLAADGHRLTLGGLGRVPVDFEVAIRARTLDGAPAGPGALAFEVEPRRAGEALVLAWRVRREAATPVLLDQVAFEAPAPEPFADPAGLTLFQHGYQSWTPTGAVRGDERPRYPRLGTFALMNHHVDSPLWGRRDGLLSSLFTVLLADGAERALLLGFLTQRAGLGEWFYRNRGVPALTASLDYGGRRLAPGETLEGEALWLDAGAPLALFDSFAAAFGAAMGARVPAGTPVGWCSWYEHYAGVDEGDVRAAARFLAAHRALCATLVQLDDGYQPAVGDWLEHNAKFPSGLPALAAEVRALGFSAGLWTAPFLVVPGSRVAREHADWLLRDVRGRRVATGYNPVWGARTFALDLTHPEVLAWLDATFTALAGQGFDEFKVDFLFAGLRRGARHDPGRSPVEAYRDGLGAVRRAVGEERFVLGCGAPLGPSVGLVDGMRVSQDVKERWDSALAAWAGRGCGYPAARGALRNDLTRWFAHRRWWINDPDCLLVRDRRTALREEEVRALVTVLGATGGMLFLSDDLDRLAEARLDLARAVLPPTVLAGRPLDPLRARDLVLDGHEGARVLVLVNLGEREERRDLPPAGEGTWVDFWRAEVVTGGWVLVPARGVRALRFTPHRAEPHLLADGLHLAAGLDGRVRAGFDPGAAILVVSVREVARAAGWLAVRAPATWVLDEAALPPGLALRAREGEVAWLTVRLPPPWERALPFRREDPASER